jgi:hypothetical protein
MTQFTMKVGGDALTTSRSFGVVNPASGDVYAQAPECSRSELDAAMDAVAKAYLSGSVWTADFFSSSTFRSSTEQRVDPNVKSLRAAQHDSSQTHGLNTNWEVGRTTRSILRNFLGLPPSGGLRILDRRMGAR